MSKVFFRQGDGIVNPGDNNSLQVCRDDCTAELHEASQLIGARHHFLPLDGATIRVLCHAGDSVEGLSSIELKGQDIYTILSDGAGWRAVGFTPVQASTPTPEPVVVAQATEPDDTEEG